MTVWNTIKNWFRSEADSAQEWSRDLQRDWSADLDRKEADLAATPSEKLESLQDQISDSTSAFDELKDQIEAAADPAVVDGPDTGDSVETADVVEEPGDGAT